jgi:hypothetical protein
VPEYRTHSYLDAFHLRHPGTAVNDAALYRLPFGLIFRYGITAPAIGVALGALVAFREQSRRRVSLATQSRTAEDPFIQLRLAESAAEIDGARERMLSTFAEMMRLARAGREIPLEQRALPLGCRQGDRLERPGGSTGCSRRAAGGVSFSTTRFSVPGAMSTRCALMQATPRNTALWCSPAPNSAYRRRTSDFNRRRPLQTRVRWSRALSGLPR